MNLRSYPLLLAFLVMGWSAAGQQPSFNAKAYLDINRIKAAHLVHGDMWWNPVTGNSACEFPKGSGKQARFVTGLWIRCDGLPVGNSLVSAQTFREYSGGNDFWPGPYGTTDYHESSQWARIWKVDRSRINEFRQRVANGQTPPPSDLNFAAIYDWPARGNTVYATDAFGDPLPLKPNTDYAPFADLNHNGAYEPAAGEYPDIKGDQMLWWIITDKGPEHTNSGSSFGPGVEIHCAAYAYSRNTAVDNMLFYELDVIPQGSPKNFQLGLFSDGGLGYPFDDYVAFDSSRRMEILYNGTTKDGSGQPYTYGDHPPTSALTLLQLPGDTGTSYRPAGSFVTYRNDFSAQGNPTNAAEFNNYLKGLWRNGAPVTRSCSGIDATKPVTPYSFPDLSTATGSINECACNNVQYNRRMILTAPPADLQAHQRHKYAFALVLTDTSGNQVCPGTDFQEIRMAGDVAWNTYYHPLPALGMDHAGGPVSRLRVYPNPARDQLYIEPGSSDEERLSAVNSMGARMPLSVKRNGNRLELDIHTWPAGTYFIRYGNGKTATQTFLKE